MDEIQAKLKQVECEMSEIEIQIDDFNRYGLSTDDTGRIHQLKHLQDWKRLHDLRGELEEIIDTIEKNQSYS